MASGFYQPGIMNASNYPEVWEYLYPKKDKFDEEYMSTIIEKYAPHYSFDEACIVYKLYVNRKGISLSVRDFLVQLCKNKHQDAGIFEIRSVFGEAIGKLGELNIGSKLYCEVSADKQPEKLLKHYYPDIILRERKDKNSIDEKIDVILSLNPFVSYGTEREILPGIVTKDYMIANIDQYIDSLQDEGSFYFLTRKSFLYIESEIAAIKAYEKKGLFVANVFLFSKELTVSAYNYEVVLIEFKKHKPEYVYIANISNDINKEEALKNALKKKRGKNYSDGYWEKAFHGFKNEFFQKSIRRRIGKVYGSNVANLRNYVVDIKYIDNPETEKDESLNVIYFPVGSDGDVTSSLMTLSEMDFYYRVEMKDIAYAKFAKFFFNSPIGKEIRNYYQDISLLDIGIIEANSNVSEKRKYKSLEIEGYLERAGRELAYSEEAIKEFPFPEISEDDCIKILNMENSLIASQKRVTSLQTKYEGNPSDTTEVSRFLALISKEDSVEAWNDSLPYPLAAILRRYIVQQEYKEKLDSLLFFFEATSMFFSTIFLSVLEIGKSKINSKDILNTTNINYYEHSSFGSWNYLNEILSAFFRRQLKQGNIQIITEIFCCSNLANIDAICNPEIFSILKKVASIRNEWKGHGGLCSKDTAKQVVNTLEEYLLEFQRLTWDVIERVQIIKPIGGKRMGATYVNRFELLKGDNPLFKVVESSDYGEILDGEALYLSWKDGEYFSLMPVFVMSHADESIKSACYFFNRYDKGASRVRYVSYHYENTPEVTNNNTELWTRLEGLFEN